VLSLSYDITLYFSLEPFLAFLGSFLVDDYDELSTLSNYTVSLHV
jgi:hypothetical protein